MVGIIKQTGTVNKNSGVVISKKMVIEIGFILIVALLALVAIQIFQSSTASNQDLTTKQLQQKNAQQAEQQVKTGTSTSSQANNAGQETATTAAVEEFYAKYKENVNAVGGKESLVAINSILQTKIPLRNFAGVYIIITDLKPSGIKGYVENTEKNSHRLSIVISGLTADGRLAFEATTPVVLELKGNAKKDFIIGRDDPTTPAKGLIPLENTKFLVVKSR